MTIDMTIREQIRRLDAAGVSGRQIAKDLGVSRDSVSKYVGVQDFSPKPPVVYRRPGASVLLS
jgi:IS30 family transposase